MEGDGKALLRTAAWLAAMMTYARFASSTIRPGRLRLLALLPVVVLLPFLPWSISSVQLRGAVAFFLAWLGVFKLLLLSFGLGPLSAPSLPLHTFLAVSSLPVNLRSSSPRPPRPSGRLLLQSVLKVLLLSLFVPLYRHRPRLHPHFLVFLYGLHIYLVLDLMLGFAAFLIGLLLGLELEPQFDAPLLSTSLRDFWGRRWNLMVTGILRPSVYRPVSARWGSAAGVMATFLVSGLMHEAMFYYITLSAPTGEVSCFFLLHGACLVAEGRARRRGWGLGRAAAAAPLVVLGFVAATGLWLFFPPMLRNGAEEKLLGEFLAVAQFLGGGGWPIAGGLGAVG